MPEVDRANGVLDPTGSLSDLSRIITSGQSFQGVVSDVVALAKARIAGTDEASLTLIERRKPTTVASTGPLAVELDERQYQTGWGPCLDAAMGGEVLVIEDTESEARWPQFTQKAVQLGLGSSLSAPLPSQELLGGGLNLYALRPRAFPASSLDLARSFATHVSLAIAQAYRFNRETHQVETLREAMRSRAVIEQAKGALMAARQCDAEEAFQVLVRLSQNQHVKLRDLAAQILAQASGHRIVLDD